MSNSSEYKVLFLLHILLALYSTCGIFSKMAGRQPFLSLSFFLFYGLMILVLGIYALAWQQIIKRLPLTTAFANKAVTVVWGLIWGVVFFGEKITVGKVLGIVLVVLGIVLFTAADGKTREERGE